MTPPEAYRTPSQGNWVVRSVPNRYSVLSSTGVLWKKIEGLQESAAGVGLHEVILETPRHDASLAVLSEAEVQAVVATYLNRFTAFCSDPRVEHVSLFKNHGVSAGTSLEHPHAQIVGLPMTPVQFRRRAEDALRYYTKHGACLVCRVLEDEARSAERVVYESPGFLAFIPYAALSPFHLWIFPKRHESTFGGATAEELMDLAHVLRVVLRKVYFGLNNPDYNFVLLSGAPSDRLPHLHWYWAIIPQVTKRAGFELETGMYVNPSLPETSAAFLRDVEIERHMLGEPQPLESAHTTAEECLSVVTEDDNVVREVVESVTMQFAC